MSRFIGSLCIAYYDLSTVAPYKKVPFTFSRRCEAGTDHGPVEQFRVP